eukprot:765190-Pleurochrysis_carterae.AAC.3
MTAPLSLRDCALRALARGGCGAQAMSLVVFATLIFYCESGEWDECARLSPLALRAQHTGAPALAPPSRTLQRVASFRSLRSHSLRHASFFALPSLLRV